MKFVLAVVILLLVYLFYPFRELYVKENPFTANYTLVAKGFWSISGCVEAAQAQQASDYKCREYRAWSRLFRSVGGYSQGYGQGYGQSYGVGE